MKTIALSAQVREGRGKGNSRRLRSEGFVPAIFYGYETESVAVKVNTFRTDQSSGRGRGRNILCEAWHRIRQGR